MTWEAKAGEPVAKTSKVQTKAYKSDNTRWCKQLKTNKGALLGAKMIAKMPLQIKNTYHSVLTGHETDTTMSS